MTCVPAYYNEIDPHAAEWLRSLIAGGHIAPGDVDERSITDVEPVDLAGYAQCHFFAGIGGWSYALRLAGWPDDRPVWTGSCPCQPFSVAGAQRGSNDERHLWPAFFRLIRERRPAKVFGEQVAGPAGLAWLDHVCADLEDAGYAAGAADLCAAGIGAPHIRQRLYWVADAEFDHRGRQAEAANNIGPEGHRPADWAGGRGCASGSVAHTDGGHARAEGLQRGGQHGLFAGGGGIGALDVSYSIGPSGRGQPGSGEGMGESWAQSAGAGADGGVGHASRAGLQGHRPDQGSLGWDGAAGSVAAPGIFNPWADPESIACRDGKARPTQRGIFALAHGLPAGLVRGGDRRLAPDSTAEGRVMRLRGYGNAIVPQLAAAFIRAAA